MERNSVFMASDFVFLARDFALYGKKLCLYGKRFCLYGKKLCSIKSHQDIIFLHHFTQSKLSFLGAPYKYYGEVSALFSDCFKYYFKHFYLLLQGFFPLFSGKSAIVC